MHGALFRTYFFAALVLLVLWEVCAMLFSLPILPSPIAAMGRLVDIFADAIALHAVYSLGRVAEGLCFAVAIGVPLGIVMGYAEKVDSILAPVVYLLYPIPKIALLPILMLLFGIGEFSKVTMMFLIIVFQVVIAVRDSVRAIPREAYEPLISLGASFREILRHVLIPATLPKFLTALRVAMATAISVLFFTETFGTKYGMGYFIMDAWMRVNYLDMYAGILVLSGIGLLLFGILDFAEHILCRWQEKQ